MLGLNCRGDFPLMRRRRAFRPSRDTLLPNLGLLPQISQTADTETPIPNVIASGGRATKRSFVARAVMFGAKPPTMQARRDRPNPERSAVRRSERMHGTSARDPQPNEFMDSRQPRPCALTRALRHLVPLQATVALSASTFVGPLRSSRSHLDRMSWGRPAVRRNGAHRSRNRCRPTTWWTPMNST